MMNGKKNRKKFISRVFAAVFLFVFAAQGIFAKTDDDAETVKALDYLKEQIRQTDLVYLDTEEQKILNAEVLKSCTDFHYGDGSSSEIMRFCFLKHKGSLQKFDSEKDLISSPEFLKAINSNFRLKTDKDMEAFCNLLHQIDDNLRGKIFKEKNKVCCVISTFFSEVDYYEISLKPNGKIEAIKNIKKEMDLPENTKSFNLEQVSTSVVNKKDKALITESVKKDAPKISYTMIELKLGKLKKNIRLYDSGFTVTYKDEYGSSSTQYIFNLLKCNDKYEIIQNPDNLFENKNFKKAVISSYSIKNETEAKQFEVLLDNIKYPERHTQKHFKQGFVWCFVREERFGDLTGFLVSVDETGKILNIEKSESIDAAAITEAEAKTSNMLLDFEFTLEKPSSTEITVKAGEEIPVEISFNADAVNAKGAYILTIVDGYQDGMSAGSNMQSPFKSEIPTDYLVSKYGNLDYMIAEYGKGVHIVEFVLVVDQEPFETIRIKVIIQ